MYIRIQKVIFEIKMMNVNQHKCFKVYHPNKTCVNLNLKSKYVK